VFRQPCSLAAIFCVHKEVGIFVDINLAAPSNKGQMNPNIGSKQLDKNNVLIYEISSGYILCLEKVYGSH
jgi:hypothetical protein